MGAKKQARQAPSTRWNNLYSRLSNDDIFGVFDEYGLKNRLKTSNDFNWVRENLPNNPEELRKILKIELDKENKLRKDAMKNINKQPAANPPQELAQPFQTEAKQSLPLSADGQGGASDLTLANLLNNPRVRQDQGVNGVTMAKWLQGNASLLPRLAQLGYTIDDLVNEAYSQTRNNRSAFSGDMTTVYRNQNTPYQATGASANQNNSNVSAGLSTTPLGASGVNHLFQLFLGRNATQQELNAWSGRSDSELRPTLLNKTSNLGSSNNNQVSSLTSAKGTTTPFTSTANSSLVKFSSDPNGDDVGDASTIWFVDHDTKTFRPITSLKALRDLYQAGDAGEQSYQAALNSLTVLNPTELQNGVLKKYIDLGWEYRIEEGRLARQLDYNPQDLQNAYGSTISEASDLNAIQVLNSFLRFLKLNGSDPDGVDGIRTNFLEELRNDSATMALYINALANGDYTPNDIYKDIKRRQLIADGNTELSGVTVIHPNINRLHYTNTNPGRNAQENELIQPPDRIGEVNREIWDSPASKLNDDYFSLIDPENYDPYSPEFKEALSNIKLEIYEYIYQALKSGLDSDKIMADSKWREFNEEIERTYGYKLSDNAMEAWKQIEEITAGSAESGLMSSGITEEQHQDVLRHFREENRRLRETKAATVSSKENDYMSASASPEQINAMNIEDAAAGLPRSEWRAYKMGLVPLEEVTWSGFLSDFRTRFPDLADKISDDEIKERYYNQLYDDYGNYRSALYQNYQDSISMQKLGFTLSGGVGTTELDKRIARLTEKRLQEEERLQKDASKIEDGTAFSNNPYGDETIDYGDSDASALADKRASERDGVISNNNNNAGANPHLATLSSPDGAYKTVVSANSKEASSLLSSGWKLGATGREPMELSKVWTKYNITPPTQTETSTTYTPPDGYKYIPNVDEMKNYTSIKKDPNSNKHYGIPNKSVVSPVTPVTPAKNTLTQPDGAWSPQPGYKHIPNVAAMGNYTNITKDPNSNKLYGLPK